MAVARSKNLFSPNLISSELQSVVPKGFILRPLRRSDYDKGFLETLSYLSEVGDLSRETFESIFDAMQQAGNMYFTIVLEDTATHRVVATGTVVIELKFIHGGSKAAHLEDLVVNKDYQKRGFGRLIHLARDHIVGEAGCYKGVLDCRNYNVKFHEKAGYTATGVYMKKRYDGAPIEDFLLQEPNPRG
ncbi:acyl-CoA N-acyltransferase [Xylaria arbuscula]|nr:acyl-CoA N-acyltransferase [Xylaria arbuscula]